MAGSGTRRGFAWATLVAVLAVGCTSPAWTAPSSTGGPLPMAATMPAPVAAEFTPTGHPINGAVLGSRLRTLKRDGLPDIALSVVDASGAVVHEANAKPKAPASTMKVLTALVAVDVLGPERRFLTRVVRGAAAGEIVLVGGGDPLLQSTASGPVPGAATLTDLARLTASALGGAKATPVTVRFDTSLYPAPAWNPDWGAEFKWSVAPIQALIVDHARPDPTSLARTPAPAAHAAKVFAALLSARGLRATPAGGTKARPDAPVLASVRSLPVSAIAEHALAVSDNDAAESLLWQAALARGRPAGFASSRAVLTAELKARGLWSDGMGVADGNGISARNRVSPTALARAIRLAVQQPRLRSILTGLPVAGATGTLAARFTSPEAAPGRGVVRAKTGSIATVDALAGYLVNADGAVLTFAFLLNNTPADGRAATWLDQASAVVASCGC